MTTAVVVRKGGVCCIAADTLARYGSTRESADFVANSNKLVQIDDAWLCPTGPASAQLVLRSYFSKPEHSRDFSSTAAIFETVREMQGVLKDDYFLNPKEDEDDEYDSMQMELLIASPGGIFGAYPLRSIQEFTRFYAFGSGSDYAMGAMQVLYDQHESAEEIARRAVAAASTFDVSSSLPCDVATLRVAE